MNVLTFPKDGSRIRLVSWVLHWIRCRLSVLVCLDGSSVTIVQIVRVAMHLVKLLLLFAALSMKPDAGGDQGDAE